MSNEFRPRCPLEGRTLLCLFGQGFFIILIFQYFELLQGNVFLSLFSLGRAKVSSLGNFSTGSLSAESFCYRNRAVSNGVNFTDSNSLKYFDGKDASKERSGDTFDFGCKCKHDDESPCHNSTVEKVVRTHSLAQEKATENNQTVPEPDITSRNKLSPGSNEGEVIAPAPAEDETVDTNLSSPLVVTQKTLDSSPSFTFPAGLEGSARTPVLLFNASISSVGQDSINTVQTKENVLLKTDLAPSAKYNSKNRKFYCPDCPVVSLSEMNDMLLTNLGSSHLTKPQWSSAVDQELLHVKSQIQDGPNIQNDPRLYAQLYRNLSMFERSYELMEQTLKVYIYKEGERPIFHDPILRGMYASEGWFMKLLSASNQFTTENPEKAHLFYLPFSSQMLMLTLYMPNSHKRRNLVLYLNTYLNLISTRYQFWNRTNGADHFLVACHDWGPAETRRIMANCIRALCNADVKEGFLFGKDVSLPETYVRLPQNPLQGLGGLPPNQRHTLAFFAGKMHGYLRPVLLKYWENKDPDMKISGPMPKVEGQRNYIQAMKSSKYCICAKGNEVNSPRVVESIFYECVPVIISDNFVPPFFGTLNWESFAIFVLERDIPNLKNILLSIPEEKYLEMQRNVRLVQQHFLWHDKPIKYDIFHMILHSIWFNRVFQVR